MYTPFYKLKGRPFQLTPDPRFYFNSRTHKKAMAYLTYGLNQGEGFIIITGDIGAGKTTLVGNLLNTLDREHYLAGKVVTTQLDADNILRMVAIAFQLPHEGMDKAALLQRIEQFLREAKGSGKRPVLIVDEAQNLPNASLEELRMLSNFVEGEGALMQAFLLGQPQFRDRLANDPDLEQVRQRVIASYHLLPMADAEETGQYIRHRLKLVEWQNDPEITKEAVSRIHEFCGGVPRRINTLCSRLLLYGFLEELHRIDSKVVNTVIADLVRDNDPIAQPAEERAKDTMAGKVNSASPVRGSSRYQGSNAAAYPAGSKDLAARLTDLEKRVAVQDEVIGKAMEALQVWLKSSGKR